MARILLDSGYTNVTPILGGFNAWIEAGYPVEGEGVSQSNPSEYEEDLGTSYTRISPDQLKKMLVNKDFLLVNVHIPNEGNIPGTDLEIPYDEIVSFAEELPEDKGSPIVLYCKGESMSLTAAQSLLDLGYSEVTILDGGYLAWRDAGYSLTIDQ